MKQFAALLFAPLVAIPCAGQVLVDSIPYPGQGTGVWGIHVTADTIFLGSDFTGNIRFSDHNGTILSELVTGLDFNHGLIRKPGSFLIAEDFTTNGAHLYEVDNAGNTINTWTFPDVIGGPSSGIGDLCADGSAVWYTMYYPDFPNDPYAYAYKWVPGDATAIDTVPMHGEQPYGIALKGDTLFYVTDNLNGDQERIYAYNLTTEQDLGWIELPDTPIDNDQRPQGMVYDGEFLYLVANRQGNNINAYQTVYIYAFDASTAIFETEALEALSAYPLPANATVVVRNALNENIGAELLDASGRVLRPLSLAPGSNLVDISDLSAGTYLLRAEGVLPVRLLVH
ncbi:MAG: T9SS type A sorting domain-containing protein [Flavobacteriales bacterium]|nr:T9SS type A sorting domain-containing protein [Flavobacteriales bacterium]